MASDDRQAVAGPSAGQVAQAARQGRTGLFARLRDDRRGATAAAFGIMATVVVGMAGLATEAGRWYDIRRDAQNAADLAAIAGALRLQYVVGALNQTCNAVGTCNTPRDQGLSAATGVATLNGFTNNVANTLVNVSSPPTLGNYTTNPRAVEVIIDRGVSRLISGLFIGGNTQRIYARGVAATLVVGPACVLGLSDSVAPTSANDVRGGVTVTGNTNLVAPDCIIASNSPVSDSMLRAGSGSINASTIYTLGGCSGCNSTSVTLASPPVPGVATDDPFRFAQSVSTTFLNDTTLQGTFVQPTNNQIKAGWQVPSMNTTNWSTTTGGTTTNWPFYIVTSDITVGNNETLVLRSGTYFFLPGVDLKVTGGNICISDTATTTCPATLPTTLNATAGFGVNLVFASGQGIGSGTAEAGTLTLNGNGIMTLQAKNNGPYAGIAIYRQDSTTNIPGNRTGNNNTDITINGGSQTRIAGGVYAPLARATITGNADMSTQGCLVLVAGDVIMQGSSVFRTTNCEAGGTNAPQLRVVRLLE